MNPVGTIVALTLVLLSGVQSGPVAETTTRHAVSLKSGDASISAVVLTNTHARTYSDPTRGPFVPDRCELEEKTPGVIWKVVAEGAAVSSKEITVTDEKGQSFIQVCWSSSGTVYRLDANGNRTGGGPQSEFLAAGPDVPSQLTVRFGTATAVISLKK